MLRRPPTTIKLTPEDIHDYDNNILQEAQPNENEILSDSNQRAHFSQNKTFKDALGFETANLKPTMLQIPGTSGNERIGTSSPAQ